MSIFSHFSFLYFRVECFSLWPTCRLLVHSLSSIPTACTPTPSSLKLKPYNPKNRLRTSRYQNASKKNASRKELLNTFSAPFQTQLFLSCLGYHGAPSLTEERDGEGWRLGLTRSVVWLGQKLRTLPS